MLVNPPYVTLTSALGVGHQVPLGLLLVGGSLIDAGFHVRLLDAESMRLRDDQIAADIVSRGVDVVMTGHAGSTPAHPVCMRMLRTIKRRAPGITTIYGGVFPTYHARQILRDEPAVDFIVRGEGEAVAVELLRALGSPDRSQSLRSVDGIAFRNGDEIVLTPRATPIADLDSHRAGWELIDDWDRYQCFGLGRAAIVQFSRGCPHRCTYCGQHGFWTTWRHRDPIRLADEIAWLHDEHNVRFITIADENPTTSQRLWRHLLEELTIRRTQGRDISMFATIRASDIVRDAEFLRMYRSAGILYVLLGIDATDPAVIEAIRKRSSATQDQRACQLLREHGIRSIIAHIVGLSGETWSDMRRSLRVLKAYDGDLLNAMYATPHSWTPFARQCVGRSVVQADQRCWDYRHQVLGMDTLRPWQLFLAVKWMELAFHLRPSRLWRMLHERDPMLRRQLWWTALHIGTVWAGEIAEFVFRTRFSQCPRELREWMHNVWTDETAADARDAMTELRVGGRSLGDVG